jgi:hypothetical protein
MLATAIQVWRSRCETGVRWGILVLLTILASPHLLTYDLVLLSIPLLTLANWAVSHRDDRRHEVIRVLLLLAYLAPFSSNLARLWPVQASVIAIGVLTWLGVSVSREMNSSSGDLRAASAAPEAA